MPHSAARSPQKCMIVNLQTDETKTCQFNPEKFTRQHVVNYGRITVPGLGYQVLQFSNTTNVQMPSIEFVMDRLVSFYDIEDFVRFVDALTVPARGSIGPQNSVPPVALFTWPGVFSFEAVVTSFKEVKERITVDGLTTRSVVTITLEEKRDLQRLSEDVRNERHSTSSEVLNFEFEFA